MAMADLLQQLGELTVAISLALLLAGSSQTFQACIWLGHCLSNMAASARHIDRGAAARHGGPRCP